MLTLVSNQTNALALRDYQNEVIQNVFTCKKRRPVVVAATGAGKTVIASYIMTERLKQGKGPILFLAHREELLDQTIKKFQAVYDSFGEKGKEVRVGIVQDTQNEMDVDVCVASVASMTRRIKDWMKEHPNGTPTIITDECHHATADTYIRIYQELGYMEALEQYDQSEVLEELDGMHLGLTATPFRTDQKHLGRVFDDVVASVSMKRLIEEGFLVPPKSIVLPILDDQEWKQNSSDSDFYESVNQENINAEIYRAWQEHAKGRSTIGFCTSLTHAEGLTNEFKKHNVPAAFINGEMDRKIRRDLLQQFSTGSIQVVFNYGVLTEGFDCPEASALIMARPTQSLGLFTQMVGRGLRIAPHIGKEDCLVLDVVGVSENFKLITVETLLGIENNEEEKKEKDASTTRGRKESIVKRALSFRFNWVSVREGVWLLKDFSNRLIRVQNINQEWIVNVGKFITTPIQGSEDPSFSKIVYQGSDREMAWEVANTYAHVNLEKNAIRASNEWLTEPPSDRQINVLRKRNLPIPNTKLEANLLIDKPTEAQMRMIRFFLNRNHLSKEFLPETFGEASVMINVLQTSGYRGASTVLQLWNLLIPHRNFKLLLQREVDRYALHI